MLSAEIKAIGKAIDFERDSLLQRNFEYALQVQRILRTAVDIAALRVAEATHVRITERLLNPLSHLPPRHPLSTMDARLYPLELGEDVVREVEPSVGEDVAFGSTQDTERRKQFIRGRDLLSLAANVVGSQSADGADGGRVVADREIFVPPSLRRTAHPLDTRPAIRPCRVAMEVAANVFQRHESRRVAAKRLLTQLWRTPRYPQRAKDGLFVGPLRNRLERGDVRLRASGADQRGPEGRRIGDNDLEWYALHRHSHRPPLLPVRERDDLRQRDEALQHRGRIPRRTDHRQDLARVAPPPHVTCDLAAESGGDTSDQVPGAVKKETAPGTRLALAPERIEQARLGLRPDPWRGSQAPRGRGLAKLVRSADIEGACKLKRALCPEPEVAAEPDEIWRELTLELR